MRLALIDYGIGNIGSAANACRRTGVVPNIVNDGKALLLLDPTHIILPGVGAVGEALKAFRDNGFLDPCTRLVMEDKVPFLGICVGMHMLADTCYEFGPHEGLGWVPGRVSRLQPADASLPVPHIGWNTVHVEQGGFFEPLDGEDFYFAHSYSFRTPAENVATTTDYGGKFVSGVMRGNIIGVQFHPEKSSFAGGRLLKLFSETRHV